MYDNKYMKRGRPKKAAAERRGALLVLRLTKAEFNKLALAAKEKGQTISEYARKLLER